jgi:hypothetical protein
LSGARPGIFPETAAGRRLSVTTSGIEGAAMRLLESFHDLSVHDPIVHVPLESPDGGGAATRAGLVQGSTERDVAVRYLLNLGYLKAIGEDYGITVKGIDRVRELRGLEDPTAQEGRNHMSDKTQRRLLTVLAIAIALGLSRPLTKFIAEQIPERRGVKDDLKEAAIQGVARTVAILAASVIVRRLAGRR